jgi:hypothetical protein
VVVMLVKSNGKDRHTGDRPQQRADDHGGHENSSHNQRVSHVVHRPASRFHDRPIAGSS